MATCGNDQCFGRFKCKLPSGHDGEHMAEIGEGVPLTWADPCEHGADPAICRVCLSIARPAAPPAEVPE